MRTSGGGACESTLIEKTAMSLARSAAVAFGLFCVAQIVPYGRAHTNPPVLSSPAWDSSETRTLFLRVCANCHSNRTAWPWYSFVAPASWLVQHDVDEGRSHFNVSEWGRAQQHGDKAADMVRDGKMPPWFYRPFHASDQLSPAESERFILGLERTFAGSPGDEGHGDHEH